MLACVCGCNTVADILAHWLSGGDGGGDDDAGSHRIPNGDTHTTGAHPCLALIHTLSPLSLKSIRKKQKQLAEKKIERGKETKGT